MRYSIPTTENFRMNSEKTTEQSSPRAPMGDIN